MPRKFVKRRYSKAKPKTAVDKKQEKEIRYLKRMVKLPEVKLQFNVKNNPLELTAGTNAMTQFLLTDIAQGVTSGTRTGDQISVRAMKMDFISNYQDALNGVSNFLRVMIVRIKGLYRTITPSQLLQFYQVAATQRFDNMLSPYNTDYTRQPSLMPDSNDCDQHVLMDKIIPFDPVKFTTSGMTTTKFKKFTFIKHFRKPLSVTWSDNGSQAQGHIALIVLPGCSTSSANNPAFTWQNTVYFTDS